jgi:hypothetical protein
MEGGRERKGLSKKWHYLFDQKLAVKKGFNWIIFFRN